MRSLVSEAEDMLDIDDDHFLEYCVEASAGCLCVSENEGQ